MNACMVTLANYHTLKQKRLMCFEGPFAWLITWYNMLLTNLFDFPVKARLCTLTSYQK